MKPSSTMEVIPSPPSPDEDAALVSAAQRDPSAFSRLYRRYVNPVYRYMYSRTGQTGDAEDLTAQVFVEAIESLARYRHAGPFAAWLFTIARRRMIDYFRRRQPTTVLDEQIESEKESTDPLMEVVRREEIRRLRDRIAALRDADQELLRLRFAADLNFREIARVLSRSEAAVKMNLYRLLDRLEREWEKNHE